MNLPAEDHSNYLEINRQAYDTLAFEYSLRRDIDRQRDHQLVDPFVSMLRQNFPNQPLKVLDAGCGNGLNLAMFFEQGICATGIDISHKMLEVAAGSCPEATLIQGDVLQTELPVHSFQGIFAKAIVHLFPEGHAHRLFLKFHRLLVPRGVLYVTTTVDTCSSEGFREKTDYPGRVLRYRRTWPAASLSSAVEAAGFVVKRTSYNSEEGREKQWFNIWAEKCE